MNTDTNVPISEQFKDFCSKIRTLVKEARHETMTTQDELAKEIGCTRKDIISFESGEKTEIELLIKLCEHYDINIEFNINQKP